MRKAGRCEVPLGMIILTSSFLLGGVLGLFLASLVTGEGEVNLSAFFLSYFTAIQEGSATPNLITSIWTNLKTPLLAFIFGFSFLGVVGIPCLLGMEGFILAFSISSLCRLMGMSGLIPSFFLFCLPAMIWIPMVFLISFQSFYAALLLWRRGKKEEVYPKGYFMRTAISFAGILLNISFEYFLLPLILKALFY